MGEFRFTEINETGRLGVWADGQPLLHFKYSNPFYGCCTLVGRLVGDGTRFTLVEESLSVERRRIGRGSASALESVAKSCCKHALDKHPEWLKGDLSAGHSRRGPTTHLVHKAETTTGALVRTAAAWVGLSRRRERNG
jgi:hypothetical protein